MVKKYKLDVPNVSTTMNQVLQELILEQPLTKYTLNSSLAKQKGKTQREVHLGSGQASQWTSQRNQHDLNNNPSPNASTGFKLNKGNAYRKLDQSWPIYQPIDGTKQGKGKDSSGWSSTEATTAKNDAPSVTGGGSSSGTFTNYLNIKQALERIGILFDDQTPRNVITQLYQPNKVKSGQYQQNNTYHRLIEPDKWQSNSDLSGMNNLLNMLSSKNIKQKLGKGAASSQGSKTPFPSLFLIQIVIVIKLHQEPLKRLILWKVIKNHQ